MSRLASALSIALLAFAAACSEKPATSGGGPAAKPAAALLTDADKAIASEDWKKALASLDAAIADPKATADEKAQAWQDKIFCEARANGDAAAKAALAKLVDAKVDLKSDQFAKLGNDLRDAGNLKAAVDVLEAATLKFKGDPAVHKRLSKLAKALGKQLEASGDDAALKKLASLGYLGTSSDDDE